MLIMSLGGAAQRTTTSVSPSPSVIHMACRNNYCINFPENPDLHHNNLGKFFFCLFE